MKKYLINGEEVEAVQQLDDGQWLVYRYFLLQEQTAPDDFYEHEEIMEDMPFLAKQVFDTPPISKIDDSVKAQQKRLEVIQRDITGALKAKQALESEFLVAKRIHVERMKKYTQYGPSMDNLDAVLNGEITHFVTKSRYDDIGHVEEYKKEDFVNRYRGPKKFLILGQNNAGELRWYLNEYDELADSFSHDNKFIWPCTSEKKAREIVQRQINEVQKPDRTLLDYAKKHGYTVQEGWEEQIHAEERANRTKELEKAQIEVELAQKRMDKLNGEIIV